MNFNKETEIAMLKARINKLTQNPINFKVTGVLTKLRKKLAKLEME